MDNETSGTGNRYDYGFRIYNPRIAKFLSVDPLTKSYPMLTPYQFAGNTPIMASDLDGLEPHAEINMKIEDMGLLDGTMTAEQVRENQNARAVGAIVGGVVVADFTFNGGKFTKRTVSNLVGQGVMQAGFSKGKLSWGEIISRLDLADAGSAALPGSKWVGLLTQAVFPSIFDYTIKDGYSSTGSFFGGKSKTYSSTAIDFGVNSALYGGGIALESKFTSNISSLKLQRSGLTPLSPWDIGSIMSIEKSISNNARSLNFLQSNTLTFSSSAMATGSSEFIKSFSDENETEESNSTDEVPIMMQGVKGAKW